MGTEAVELESARTSPVEVSWVKQSNNSWHLLKQLAFAAIDGSGVYIIWHGGYPSRIVHVGFGTLSTELEACSRKRRLTAFEREGPLYVTWAVTDPDSAAGICATLTEKLRPAIQHRARETIIPIAENSPF